MAEQSTPPKSASVKWKDGKKPAKQRFVLKPRRKDPVLEFPFGDDDFQALSTLVYEISGILLPPHKKDMVYARLVKRLRTLSMKTFKDYLHYLSTPKGTDEIARLANAMTTNLTHFFREPHHFEHLVKNCLNVHLDALKSGRKKRLRLWSAGCSSGEEAYCLAYCLHKFLNDHDLTEIDAKILATDMDTDMLRRARNGIYPKETLKKVPLDFLATFQMDPQHPDKMKIDPVLRKLIAFKTFNFKSPDWPMTGPFDAIFCRNVMIYFDATFKSELAEQFGHLLDRGGFLYVGHSENIKRDGLIPIGQTTYQKS